jgi:hypothetical protein
LIIYDMPKTMSREQCLAHYREIAPGFLEAHGFIRKQFIYCIDGKIAGGAYMLAGRNTRALRKRTENHVLRNLRDRRPQRGCKLSRLLLKRLPSLPRVPLRHDKRLGSVSQPISGSLVARGL